MTSANQNKETNKSKIQEFVHLRLHTAYSLCEGAVKIEDLTQFCVDNYVPAACITDTNNMFGALEFSVKCSSYGIQPIIGVTIDLSYDGTLGKIVLLATSEEGYRNLLHLSRAFYIDNKKQHHITMFDIAKYDAGIIALSGGYDGPAGNLYSTGNTCSADEFLSQMREIFGNRFYIEISRQGIKQEQQTEGYFIKYALDHNIPLVATNRVYFLKPEMYDAHDILICIADGTYASVTDRRRANRETYFKTDEEMAEIFKDIPEAISNTVQIAKRCHFRPDKKPPMLPKFDDGSGRCEDDTIREQAIDGLKKRLNLDPGCDNSQIPDIYFSRLTHELDVIKEMGFSGYFLIVSDFVKWSKDHGIPVGPGRGSGAGSLVAWSLLITDLDPIHYSLIFERFLNIERISMPDFDIDFCQERRDEVIEYVRNKYGNDRVAHIIALGKFQARAIVKDVGRAMQMSYNYMNQLSKLIPQSQVRPINLSQALQIEPQLIKAMEEDERVKNVIEIALQLEGLYRHASLHAAGIAICKDPIDNMVPVYSDDESEIAVTQFSMKYVEMAGIVKFDFLGLKTLTFIKNCCDTIMEYRGINIDISKIPVDDKKTFDSLCDVDVVGVFQLESAGMMDVIQKLKPDNIEDIIALVSLYRPGPMDDIPKYLARKHKIEPITYPHPILEPILNTTYGVMVYQEQVIKIAQEMGGYTLAKADILRRAMGKKIKEEMDQQREIFINGAKQKNISHETASHVFDLMQKFASYGFNRSHATPYAMLAYQTAYLKSNYPLEFFVSLMNIDISNPDKLSIFAQDACRHGIKILPPDINKSNTLFKPEGDNAIRYALGAIKGNSSSSIEKFVKYRDQFGGFENIYDVFRCLKKLGYDKKKNQALILSGSMDTIHSNRRQLIESYEDLMGMSTSSAQQNSLFTDKGAVVLADVPDYEKLERLKYESECIGFYLSSHPVDIYSKYIKKLNIMTSSKFCQTENATIVAVLMDKNEKLSKTRKKFAFLVMSDQENTFDVTVFQELYSEVGKDLVVGQVYLLKASIDMKDNRPRITAKSISPIDKALKEYKTYLRLKPGSNIESVKAGIQKLHDGNDVVNILVDVGDKTMIVNTNIKKDLSIERHNEIYEIDGIDIVIC